MTSSTTHYTYTDSPIGPLLLAGNTTAVTHIQFVEGKGYTGPGPNWKRGDGHFIQVMEQLEAYFRGELREFSLDLAPNGTKFQLRVWRALESIRYGETISYGDLAARVGNRNASRAVGAANGKNPLPIVLPCHRVVGRDGALTGYGGGLPIKEKLLAHESRHHQPSGRQIELA